MAEQDDLGLDEIDESEEAKEPKEEVPTPRAPTPEVPTVDEPKVEIEAPKEKPKAQTRTRRSKVKSGGITQGVVKAYSDNLTEAIAVLSSTEEPKLQKAAEKLTEAKVWLDDHLRKKK